MEFSLIERLAAGDPSTPTMLLILATEELGV